jgi:hypothetical protein
MHTFKKFNRNWNNSQQLPDSSSRISIAVSSYIACTGRGSAPSVPVVLVRTAKCALRSANSTTARDFMLVRTAATAGTGTRLLLVLVLVPVVVGLLLVQKQSAPQQRHYRSGDVLASALPVLVATSAPTADTRK